MLKHQFPPLFNSDSKILILGSFPSVKSREQQFYYGNPQNRFWPLLAKICGEESPATVEEKRALAIRHKIAVWDVIESCDITGSSDSSIRNVRVNDLSRILNLCDIRQIFVNGGTAYRLFQKYQKQSIGRDAVKLPSTSPANAAWNFERLYGQWKIIEDYLSGPSKYPLDRITFQAVYEVVRKIPRGKVATYGQIAAILGNIRWARVVGYALHDNPDGDYTPCYRVVNKAGRVSDAFIFGGKNRQIELLRNDGIEVSDEGYVNMEKFQWRGMNGRF